MLVPGVVHSFAMARQQTGNPAARGANRHATAGIAVQRTTTASMHIAHFLAQFIVGRSASRSSVHRRFISDFDLDYVNEIRRL